VDLSLKSGEFFTLFGPNGAGKTTLAKIIAALLRPSRGEVRIAGRRPRGSGAAAVRRHIGFLSHRSFLYGHLTARENLAHYGGLYGLTGLEGQVARRLKTVGLGHRAGDRVRGFSRGMVQRLAIARALLHDPGLLILDEPFTGLDPAGAHTLDRLLRDVRAEGRTVLMITHHASRGLPPSDRIAVLVRGRIAATFAAREIDLATFETRYLELTGGDGS
jgi:heme exporter protein A